MDIKKYVRERDEAFISLDKEKILAFCKRYKINLPENETVFWAGVHKVIIHINSATFEQKQKSYEWLAEHGFRASIWE